VHEYQFNNQVVQLDLFGHEIGRLMAAVRAAFADMPIDAIRRAIDNVSDSMQACINASVSNVFHYT
jgi:hypothetical protein